MVSEQEIVVVEDLAALSRKAAEIFITEVNQAVEQKGSFAVALSGGSTPKKLYEDLSREPFYSQIRWNNVHLFWGDERCVPPDNPESNYHMVTQTLLSKIKIPESNIHRMKGEIDPEQGGAEYEKELRFFFGDSPFPHFDLILLGLGPDGHTASLFPDTLALNEQKRWVVSNYVDKLKMNRLTFTFPVLNQAKKVMFLVSGNEKALMLKQILTESTNFPAARVKPQQGKLVWLLDKAAALELR